MTRRVIGPFNRVEGDLEVRIDIGDDQRVSSAQVVSPLFRGFETMLQGKDPQDALVYVPRICGICSVAQSVACATALADAQGLVAPPNGELATNLILANENLADHLTHFYLFFMPDFAREIYQSEAWYPGIAQRFKSGRGSASADVLPKRAEFLHIMGLLAGKWPHSLALQPGGTTRALQSQERARLMSIVFGFRRFLESTLFGDSLEAVVEIASVQQLQQWRSERSASSSDFALFLQLSDDLSLEQLGRGSDRFLSYGAYHSSQGALFQQGVWHNGVREPLDPSTIAEDVSHSWMKSSEQPLHPSEGVTLPSLSQPDGYSWCKSPRLNGDVVEVGALARQLNNGHPLLTEMVLSHGGNVRSRVIARLLELAQVTLAMERWAKALAVKEPYCVPQALPDDCEGVGLIEAARGGLGHWMQVRRGKLSNYQIVAPTTWNFSPRDSRLQPGPLEQALVGAPVRDGETDPVSVQHIVRSFDPCMVCTVH